MTTSQFWSDARLLDESERWIWYPPGTTVWEEPEYLLSLWEQSPARNIVHWSRAASHAPDALVDEILGRLRAAGRTGVRWWVTGATIPSDMGDVLSRHGFALTEELEVLVWDLGNGAEPRLPELNVPPGVSAELVRDAAGVRAMHLLAAEGFGDAAPTEEHMALWGREVEEAERAGTRTSLECLGYVDGTPAGAAGGTLVDGLVRLWGGTVLPAYRGRGVYRALVEIRLREGFRRGGRYAMTKARIGTSGPIFKRAGFRVLGHERCYERDL